MCTTIYCFSAACQNGIPCESALEENDEGLDYDERLPPWHLEEGVFANGDTGARYSLELDVPVIFICNSNKGGRATGKEDTTVCFGLALIMTLPGFR